MGGRVAGLSRVEVSRYFFVFALAQYLLFSEPSLISLDEYVFNTEAHPLRIFNATAAR